MDPTSSLDLISKDKIHHFFAFLPLLTMILLGFNIWILIGYTFFLAIFEVYFIILTSFKTLVTKDTIDLYSKDNKIKLKSILPYLKKKFWFVDNIWWIAIPGTVIILSYLITFVYAIINYDSNYINFVLLAYVFLTIFMWRLIKAIKHLATNKKVREAFKNVK
ncbi:hypothetical protein J4226_01900 [Candidatus Pacearchaeota archaeon]|nr:hypothetical protein [Candidatus Pacearchaeota archaeon]